MLLVIEFGWNFKTVFTVILVVIAIGSYIALRITRKRLENDPEYLERQREQEEEYYRLLNEQREMDMYASELSYSDEYSDEEYEKEHSENITD